MTNFKTMTKKMKILFSTTPSVVKKGTVAMLCMVMMGLFLAVGCKKDEKKPVETEYPIDIPFMVYFVRCNMNFMTEDCENRKVAIINTKEELESYRGCIDEIYYKIFPEVDFSKYSLLFTRSSTQSDMDFINNKSLQKLSNGDYLWNMNYFHVYNDGGGYWKNMIMTEKMEKNSNVCLKIDTIMNDLPDDYSIEKLTWDYSLPKNCQWTNIMNNDVIYIGDYHRFRNHITCDDIYLPNNCQMLVTKINVPKSIKTISKKLLFYNTKYVLNLEVELSDNNQPEERIVSLLFTPESYPIFGVELNVNIINE